MSAAEKIQPPEAVTAAISEAEWQRLKRCEWHLSQVLRAVRLKNVHDRIEQARLWYRKTGSLVLP